MYPAQFPEKRRKRARQICPNFTPEELAAKRAAAIAEEALKKREREEIAKKKLEEKYIEFGRVISSLKPEDVGLFNLPKEQIRKDCLGYEILSTVFNFLNNLKLSIGNEWKGTLLCSNLAFTSALCGVHERSIPFADTRIEKLTHLRKEVALREKEQQDKIEERWIEIGKAICSFKLEDFGPIIPGTSTPAKAPQSGSNPSKTATILESTLTASKSIENNEDSEHSDEEYVEEEDDDDDDDYELESSSQKSKRSKNSIADRGEDVISNVFNFSSAIQKMMGSHSKYTCLRSAYEFTSIICHVAQKSVRDRQKNNN